MPIRMVATGRYYDKANGLEYDKGQKFDVADEAAAERLERRKRARRVAGDPEPTVAAPAAAPAPSSEEPALRRYRRRDMTPSGD